MVLRPYVWKVEITMKQITKIFLLLVIGLPLAHCASQKTHRIWKSMPPVQQVSLDQFEIQVRPLKLDNPFFVAFELSVHNKSSTLLEIDWNRSRYLFKGQDKGLLLFRGLDPKAIKNRTIPNASIPADSRMTRTIAPARTVAWMPRHQTPKPGERGFIPGILPNGDNSIHLVLVQGPVEVRQSLNVKIVSKEISK